MPNMTKKFLMNQNHLECQEVVVENVEEKQKNEDVKEKQKNKNAKQKNEDVKEKQKNAEDNYFIWFL
jgi:hypothetical protein